MLCIIVNFYCVTLSDQFCCIWLNLTRVQPCTLHDSSYFYQQSNHQPSVMVILKVGTITLPLCCLTGDVVFFGSWVIALFSPSFWYCWTLFHLSKGLFVITVQALLHVSDKLYPALTVSKCNQWFAPSCISIHGDVHWLYSWYSHLLNLYTVKVNFELFWHCTALKTDRLHLK